MIRRYDTYFNRNGQDVTIHDKLALIHCLPCMPIREEPQAANGRSGGSGFDHDDQDAFTLKSWQSSSCAGLFT